MDDIYFRRKYTEAHGYIVIIVNFIPQAQLIILSSILSISRLASIS